MPNSNTTEVEPESHIPPHLRRPKRTVGGGSSSPTSSDVALNLEPGSHGLRHLRPPGQSLSGRESMLLPTSEAAKEALHHPVLSLTCQG